MDLHVGVSAQRAAFAGSAIAAVAALCCAVLFHTKALPMRPGSREDAKLDVPLANALTHAGEQLDENWRAKWERARRELKSSGKLVAARAGTLEVIPFMSDGDNFYFKIFDPQNLVLDLEIQGGADDNPTAKIIAQPNFAGRELKAVEIDL